MKLNSRMHDWAASNTWPRPQSNSSYGTRYGRYSVNIPVTTVVQPKLKMRRCHTTLMNGPSPTSLPKGQVYKPRHNILQRESSTLDYIRYLEVTNKESEAKLKNNVHVLSVQKSRSDVNSRETPIGGFTMGGAGMMRERTQIFAPSPSDQTRREESSVGNKQEMKVGVAMVPRKGLISLSTNGDTEQLPDIAAVHVGENRRYSTAGNETPGKQKTKSLIKRKDIMDHFMAGFKRLEDEEQQKHHEEELQKSLGEYTIMDLQSKILQMTDAKSVRRPGQPDTPRSDSKSSLQHLKPEKTVLPAIKNFNPFAEIK